MENDWQEISKVYPPHREPLEWWDDYGEQVVSGELCQYDGKYVRVSMRHWYVQESLSEFTHWRRRSRSPSGEIPE